MAEQENNQSLDYIQGVQNTLKTILESQQRIENVQNDDENETTIDLAKIGRGLKEKWWIILLATVVSGIIGFCIATFIITPAYQSTVMVYVNNTYQKDPGQQVYSTGELAAAQSLVDTYIVILNSHATLDAVIQNLQLPYSYEKLKSMISASAQGETEIFAVTVTAEDPKEAQSIAQGIADVLPTSIASVMEGASIRIVDQPQFEFVPVKPNKPLYVLIFAFVGFVLSVVIIAALDMTDKKVTSEEDITQLADALHILAAIPELNSKLHRKKGKGYGYSYENVKTDQKSADIREKITNLYLCCNLGFEAQEAYKLLRTNLMFSLPDNEGCRIIGITSGQQGEAKTTTAINLCYFLAQTDKRVLLIEGDLRLPNIADRLKLCAKPGLSNVLVGFCNFKDGLQKSGVSENWFVMVGGDVPPNPSELMGSKRMASLLNDFRKEFDYVIIDLPPVGVVSDALVLAPSLDGIILVVRENYSMLPEVEEAVRRLNHKDVNLMGIAYTGSNSTQKSGYRKNTYHTYR